MFFNFTAKFLRKAYGYDISGEVYSGSGPIAQKENEGQKNINDTAQPQDRHQTPPNANNFRDADAEKEFPEELEGRGVQKFLPMRTK